MQPRKLRSRWFLLHNLWSNLYLFCRKQYGFTLSNLEKRSKRDNVLRICLQQKEHAGCPMCGSPDIVLWNKFRPETKTEERRVCMMCGSGFVVKLAKPEIHGSTLKYQTLPKPLKGPWQFCVCNCALVFINGLPKLCVSPSRSVPDEMPLCSSWLSRLTVIIFFRLARWGVQQGEVVLVGKGGGHHSGVQSDALKRLGWLPSRGVLLGWCFSAAGNSPQMPFGSVWRHVWLSWMSWDVEVLLASSG